MSSINYTTFLKLPYIPVGSTNWINLYNEMLRKVDILGKHMRIQRAAGDSLALRLELEDGSLVEILRIVPNGQDVNLYFGRPGRTDRMFIEAAIMMDEVHILNSDPLGNGKEMIIRAAWNGMPGATINTSLVLAPRNIEATTIEFPNVDSTLTAPYVGSAFQLENDPNLLIDGGHYIKVTCVKDGNTHTYLVPAYKLGV